MGKRLDSATADAPFWANGLMPLEPYVRSDTPRKCMCLKCGRTVSPRHKAIKNAKGVGCRYCLRLAIDPEEAVQRMRDNHFEPLGPYENSLTRWRSRCELTGETVTDIASRDAVHEKLSTDSSNLNMVMVHKFQEGTRKSPAYLEDALEIPVYESFGMVNESDRILLMIDEAHRTQSSDLGDNLFSAFPNATRLAFTGTPLIKVKDDTREHKSKNRFGGYIDQYKLLDSVEYGATVQILFEGKTVDATIERRDQFDNKIDDLARKHVESQVRKQVNQNVIRKQAKEQGLALDDLIRKRTDEETRAIKKKWGTTGDILEADTRI